MKGWGCAGETNKKRLNEQKSSAAVLLGESSRQGLILFPYYASANLYDFFILFNVKTREIVFALTSRMLNVNHFYCGSCFMLLYFTSLSVYISLGITVTDLRSLYYF